MPESPPAPPPPPSPPHLPVVATWERLALALILAVFAGAGLNAISHDAYIGQDFGLHVEGTLRQAGSPDTWFIQDPTSRPLIYWIAVNGIALTGGKAAFVFAACVFLALNTAALALLHDLSRRLVAPAALRLAALAFIAFLPVSLITSVVFAADAVATPPFVLLAWSLVRWHESTAPRNATRFAALAGLALVVGNFSKATFLVLPAAIVALAALAWHWQRPSRPRLLVLLALAVLLPTTLGGWLHLRARAAFADKPSWHRFTWSGTGEMTVRNLLLPKLTDARIFAAPGYWDRAPRDGRTDLPLLENNSYSYPALLHLALYTDVLDTAQRGIADAGTLRPEPQKTFSRWSVRTAVVFSLAWLAALALSLWQFVRALLPGPSSAPAALPLAAAPPRPPDALAPPSPPLPITRSSPSPRPSSAAPPSPAFSRATCLILGFTWFTPLVATLPFVHHAYDWGYWLPRLILPALWLFALCFFAQLADLARRFPRLPVLIAAAVALQSLLQLRSLWY